MTRARLDPVMMAIAASSQVDRAIALGMLEPTTTPEMEGAGSALDAAARVQGDPDSPLRTLLVAIAGQLTRNPSCN